MRKIVPLLLVVVLILSSFQTPAFADNEKVTINVYNWGQYISDGTDGYIDVNKAFTEVTGIEVNYMTFDSNEPIYLCPILTYKMLQRCYNSPVEALWHEL